MGADHLRRCVGKEATTCVFWVVLWVLILPSFKETCYHHTRMNTEQNVKLTM
jgi:hypothetical protein